MFSQQVVCSSRVGWHLSWVEITHTLLVSSSTCSHFFSQNIWHDDMGLFFISTVSLIWLTCGSICLVCLSHAHLLWNEVHYLNHIHKTAHDTHNALDHETIGVVLLHQKVFSLKEITVCCVKHTRERTDEKLSTTEYRMNGKENTAHLMSIHLIPHRFECIDWLMRL